MSFSLHRGAEQDVTDALRFYRREAGKGVALRFLHEFERVTSLLDEFPDIGRPTRAGRRSFPLAGFPYSVIYRESDAGIRILVIRHQNRDPGHGEGRS